MSSDRTRPLRTSTPPPRLDHVPPGYTPPPIKHGMTPAPLPGSALQTVSVPAEAAIRAGIPQRGDLALDSALRLFHLVAARKASGRLRVRGEGSDLTFTFRSGVPEDVRSADPSDALVRFLLERGVVDPGALVEQAPEDDSDYALVSWLLARPDSAEAIRLATEHGAGLALRALRIGSGEWEWSPRAPPRTPGTPLGSPLALLAEAVRGIDPEAVRRRLADRSGRRATLVPGAIELDELGLTAAETAEARRFDGGASPDQLAASSPLGPAAVLRIALLLFETGLAVSER